MKRLPLPLTSSNPGTTTKMSGGHPLTDSFGRGHRSLRLSLTDRCNLRCGYCMEEEASFLPGESLLSIDELIGITTVFVDLGIRKVRLTGGEPLLRQGLTNLVRRLKGIDGLTEISLTTNGILLEKMARQLKNAGLDRLTISLDSLNPKTFERITRRGGHSCVIEGIESAVNEGFKNTAINSVILKGINDQEVGDLIEFCHAKGILPRFIETMPIGAGDYDSARFVSAKMILELIGKRFGEVHSTIADSKSSPAKYYKIATGLVGIIASVSEPFCAMCDRLRLTADGKIRSCLFSLDEIDIIPLIRGVEWKNDSIINAISESVWSKKSGHGMHDASFRKPPRTMHAIGG
jgi:cyclic pyranopterin phosphate synthase